VLHALHPQKRKLFTFPLPAATSVGLVAVAMVTRELRILPLVFLPLVVDGLSRSVRLHREGVRLGARCIVASVVRGHLSFAYVLSFHLVRYYLVALVVLGALWPGVGALAAVAVVGVGAVEYATRRPRLSLPLYLAFFTAEHTAYQVGVAVGCFRRRTFRSYLPTLRRLRGAGVGI
jgi:hypothetical protein